jgi:hypothetical protein
MIRFVHIYANDDRMEYLNTHNIVRVYLDSKDGFGNEVVTVDFLNGGSESYRFPDIGHAQDFVERVSNVFN